MVRVLDGDGKPVYEGWYWRFPKNMGGAWFEGKTGETEYVEGVVRCDYGDWNMPNDFRLVIVTPPHRIEVIGDHANAERLRGERGNK